MTSFLIKVLFLWKKRNLWAESEKKLKKILIK